MIKSINNDLSASISWRPKNQDVPLDVGGSPSHFIDTIKKVFGGFPCSLGEADIPKLEVLAQVDIVCGPYLELIEAIEKFGEIFVQATY